MEGGDGEAAGRREEDCGREEMGRREMGRAMGGHWVGRWNEARRKAGRREVPFDALSCCIVSVQVAS